ncbi:MAG: hypothetical protein ACD_49C00049G0012 [uncultured bacterium (gcode 4)]|uniref:Uncharacterized protein n=1 Tax=uncultured bacterium (gcode 4) TaxID=1234023 RepID=K2BVU0_9BACT|nr:MAG: hypothetical protein ACD_49C00049G0012 [uncultured bacterium (gcode 4)]
MKKKKQKVRIKIVINFEHESWFHNSIDEVVSNIFKWYKEWFDSNCEDDYYFKIY